MKIIYITTAAYLLITTCVSCEEYLSAKPDKKMAEPSTIEDCEALLDNTADMNMSFPAAGESASDNYYLTSGNWESLTTQEDRLNYHWDPGHTVPLNQWQLPYKTVMQANQVLEVLDKLDSASDPDRYNRVRGSALFFRAYAFFSLSQLFAPQYRPENADRVPGIPIRLKSDIGYSAGRGTVGQTFERILTDLEQASALLPEQATVKTRPSKAAAYAALARTHLCMQNYEEAATYASAALQIQDDLLDYNDLSLTAGIPFARFHDEIIFHAGTSSNSALNPARAYIDSTLYAQYHVHDLRKAIFFKANPDGSQSFKGRYDAQNNASSFAGLATDELWLIRAESYIRMGRIQEGLADLNHLLENRWEVGYFTPFSTTDAGEALSHVLNERRKELLYRNLRWSDLRRLNLEPGFAKTMVRVLNGIRYELPPNDLRYTLLIPQEVLLNSTLTQNPR